MRVFDRPGVAIVFDLVVIVVMVVVDVFVIISIIIIRPEVSNSESRKDKNIIFFGGDRRKQRESRTCNF